MSFRWYFRSTPGDEQGRKLLNVLRELAPDAAPVRYGDVEPLQHRLEREGESHFYEFWAEHSLPGSLSTYLFWEGRRGSEGFLNFPLLAARRRRDYQLASQLAIETETDRSQELLAAVNGALDAFYALVDPEQPEGLQLVRDQWIGIPPTPARHIWFGEPYASLLAAGTPLADLVWRWLGQGEIQTLIEQIENAPDEDTAQVLLDRLTPEIEPARLIPPL